MSNFKYKDFVKILTKPKPYYFPIGSIGKIIRVCNNIYGVRITNDWWYYEAFELKLFYRSTND